MSNAGTIVHKSRLVHVSTSDLAIKYLLRNQLRAMAAAGYDVYGLSAPGKNRAELSREQFQYEVLPVTRRIHPAADIKTYLQMAGYFARRRFDLVHTHTNKAGVLGCWAARKAGIPRIVSTVHGFYFHERMNPAIRAVFIQLYRETFRFVDRVFMQSEEDVLTAIKHHISSEEKIVHLGNGIDLRRFNPHLASLDQDAARLRTRAGVPETALLIGIVARINHEKGYRELLHAMQWLHRNHPDVHLVAVGDGPARDHYQQLSEQLGIDQRIHFVGFSEDIPAWLTAMDIFVLPSYREGFPRTLCEAFAIGTPVVATSIRGCRELIRDGENGLLVEVMNVSSLARALEYLIENTSARKKLSDNARKHAIDNLDEQKIIRKILNVYDDLGLEPGSAGIRPARDRGDLTVPPATGIKPEGVKIS